MMRYYFIDALRLTSMVAIIVLHVAARFIVYFEKLPLHAWFFANFIDSIARFGTPIYIMISGAILLMPEKTFDLRRRFIRVMVPLFTWSLIYFAWNIYSKANYDWIRGFWDILHGSVAYHLWFPYMLMGLYLLTPLFRLLVSDRKMLEYALTLWVLFSVIFPFVEKFLGYVIPVNLNIYSGYAGYFLAGYYLTRYHEPRHAGWYLLAFVAGLCVTIFGTYFFIRDTQGIFDQFFYSRLSPGSFIMSISLFIIFKQFVRQLPDQLGALTLQMANLSYGIYLIHALVLAVTNTLILRLNITNILLSSNNPYIDIPVRSFIVITVSFIVVFVISKINFLRFILLGLMPSSGKKLEPIT